MSYAFEIADDGRVFISDDEEGVVVAVYQSVERAIQRTEEDEVEATAEAKQKEREAREAWDRAGDLVILLGDLYEARGAS